MLPCAKGYKTEFSSTYLMNLKGRDPQTEAHFAAYFSRYLEAKLRGRLRSRDLADDIRQETLARVLEAVYTKRDLRNPEHLGAFVNSVCNNVLFEHWRRNKATAGTLEVTEQIDVRPDPEISAQLAEDIAELRKVTLRLQKRDRDLLRMIYWEERDRDEISRITQTSAEHVRVMLHRAKRTLRRYLDESRRRPPATLSCSRPM